MSATPDLVAHVAPLAPLDASTLRVAIVHDYLTQRGGAERVVLSLMAAFPQARLITSVYEPGSTFPEFGAFNVEQTWLERVPGLRSDPRRAIPLLPAVFRGISISDVDVVICSSSGWAHGVNTTAPKIVYCHNPPRWLYQRRQYMEQRNLGARGIMRVLAPFLRRWDRHAATTVTKYLANSSAVASRIENAYEMQADVVPPAVTIDPSASRRAIAGLEPGFFLTVSRARAYKNADVVCRAVADLPHARLVVVGELPAGKWPARIQAVANVSDPELRWLYASAKAVVGASHEDFGLTPVEGFLFGKPAACLREGGYLDTVLADSGVFFERLTPEDVRRALLEIEGREWNREVIEAHGQRFGLTEFISRIHAAAEMAIASHGLGQAPGHIDAETRACVRLE